jgi:hypothetical protein
MAWVAVAVLTGWSAVAWAWARWGALNPSLLNRLSLLNLLVPTVIGGTVALEAAGDWSPWARMTGFGLLLGVVPTTLQTICALILFKRGMPGPLGRMTREEFARLFVSRVAALCAPAGLALCLVGAGGMVLSMGLPTEQLLAGLGALGCLVWLWLELWTHLAHMGVPGRLAPFPMPDWKRDVIRLGAGEGLLVQDVLLARTKRHTLAGAFCLPGCRLVVTDALLAALSHSEFLAVMAHELAHIRHRAPVMLVLIVGFMTTLGLGLALQMGFGASSVSGWWCVLACGMVGAAFFRQVVRTKQQQEDEADDWAVRLVGAEPLMAALVKAHLLNRSETLDKRTTRYRSLRDRLDRIAANGGLTGAAIRQVMERVQAELREGAQRRLDGPLLRLTIPARG